MSSVARGTFTVTITQEPPYDSVDGVTIGRASLLKEFQGDLTGSSHGLMTSAMAAVKGSAGYVAIERVTASLGGRSGTFVLQHSGTMARGKPSLVVSVVPDSATAELKGLTGTMAIDVADGQHMYAFDYALPAT
jgi:hypothetical protein